MDLVPGQIVGADYRVVQLLAAGGMGSVYVAEQLSTGKRRALKVMHRELAADADSQRRFMQEARVGALIASEHVVEVQNAGIDPASGHPFLVMELLEGEDLQARLARGPLSIDDARLVVDQLAHALGAAHDAHVVHRDLKPQNVFLGVRRSTGATLHVKVLDFGIAKIVETHDATAASGTPMWLAPEQTDRGHITSAADVWAFGLVVFMILTGASFWRTPARKDASVIDLLNEILRDPIPLASVRAAELGRSLPAGFDAWLARCLARPPGDRFPNARLAHAALAPLLAAPLLQAQVPPVMPPHAMPPRAMTPPVMSPHAMTAAPWPAPAPMAYAPPPTPSPSGSRLGLALVLALVGVGLLVTLGAVAIGAAYLWTAPSTSPPAASASSLAAPSTTVAIPSATAAVTPSSPESAPVNVIVLSDDPQLQSAILSDPTLNPRIAQCVASVRSPKRPSISLVVEVTGTGSKIMMTQAQPTGPHVQCVSNVFTSRPLSPSKKKAILQIVVTWT